MREPYTSWKELAKSIKVLNLWKNVCLNFCKTTKPQKQSKMIEKIAILWHSMHVEPCNLKLLHFATQWNYIVQAHTAINVKNLVKKENSQKCLAFCVLCIVIQQFCATIRCNWAYKNEMFSVTFLFR